MLLFLDPVNKELAVLRRREPRCLERRVLEQTGQRERIIFTSFLIPHSAGQTLRSPQRKASDSFHKNSELCKNQEKELRGLKESGDQYDIILLVAAGGEAH